MVNERHIPPIFCLQAHGLRFGLGDRKKPEHGARSQNDHRHHPLQPSSGDRDTMDARIVSVQHTS